MLGSLLTGFIYRHIGGPTDLSLELLPGNTKFLDRDSDRYFASSLPTVILVMISETIASP